MSRDIEPTERLEPTRQPQDPEAAKRELEVPPSREHTPFQGRTYAYSLSADELETLYDIGRFRIIATEDLAKQRYSGRAADMRQDLGSLRGQGLIVRRTLFVGHDRKKLTVLALTKAGKAILQKAHSHPEDQALYAGFVKTREMRHDAAIYRMYQAEARQIHAAGGHIKRVILDYELKRKVYAPLAKARHLPALEYARLQSEIAARNGVPILKGKIQLPDLRIEYENGEGAAARVNLELATHHYHGSHLAAKGAAGFKIYGLDDDSHPRPIVEERELTAEIFSL
jgi:hypothetical protein